MSTNYLCQKCAKFNTNNFTDLKKHLCKKKSCLKTNEAFLLSEDQLLVLSLIPNNEPGRIKIEDTTHLKNSNFLNKNKEELFKISKGIEKSNKMLCCPFCENKFKLVMDLKRHLILNCFFEELKKRENNKIIVSEVNNENNKKVKDENCEVTNVNNITNLNTINHNNTTYNITIEIKNPVGFDSDWDLSKIDELNKRDISFSNCMYTSLLEEIMKNEINLNIIIDNENNSGMVYKNDIEKYIQMKSKDIVDNTMKKLSDHLIEINKMNKKSMEDILQLSKDKIVKKYEDYEKNSNIKKYVETAICSIFETKKSDAIFLAQKNIKNYEVQDNYEINNNYICNNMNHNINNDIYDNLDIYNPENGGF